MKKQYTHQELQQKEKRQYIAGAVFYLIMFAIFVHVAVLAANFGR